MFPQVEISYNGGTILFGNDREATVFNMKQKTFEITNNLTYKTGIHNFLWEPITNYTISIMVL